MPQLLPALLTLMLINGVSLFGIQDSNDWVKYDSVEGHYSVLLPTQPRLINQEASSADGEKFQQYMTSAADSRAVFLTGYFDHLQGTIFSLDKARDGMVQAVKGTLVSEGPISLGGNSGRELKVSMTGSNGVEYLVQARFYDVDKRVYLLQFIIARADDDSVSAAKARKYFDSFTLSKAP